MVDTWLVQIDSSKALLSNEKLNPRKSWWFLTKCAPALLYIYRCTYIYIYIYEEKSKKCSIPRDFSHFSPSSQSITPSNFNPPSNHPAGEKYTNLLPLSSPNKLTSNPRLRVSEQTQISHWRGQFSIIKKRLPYNHWNFF